MFSRRHTLSWSGMFPLLPLFLGMALISVFSISNYTNNDELFLEFCYSGYWNGGRPVNDFIFQHVAFTTVIHLLYKTGIGLNFFFLTHFAVIVLCIVCMHDRLRRISSGPLTPLIVSLVVFFLCYDRFTYTAVSGLCIATSFLYGREDKYKSALFLLLGGLVRWEMLVLALLVCGVHALLNGRLFRSGRIPLILGVFILVYSTDYAVKNSTDFGNKAPLTRWITESAVEFDPRYHEPQSWSMAKNFFFASRYDKRQDLIDGFNASKKAWYLKDWKSKMYKSVGQIRKTIFGKEKPVYFLAISVLFLVAVRMSGRAFLSFFTCVAILAVMTNILDVPLLGKERVAIVFMLMFFALNREVQPFSWKVLWLLIFINCQFPINTVSHKGNHFEQQLKYSGKGHILFDPLCMITETFPGNYWQANQLKVSPGFTFFPESWAQRSESYRRFLAMGGHKDVYSVMASENFRFIIPDRQAGWNIIRSPDSVIKVWNTELGAVLGKQLRLVDSVKVVKPASGDSGKKELKYGIYRVY